MRTTTHVVIRKDQRNSGSWWWVCVSPSCMEGTDPGMQFGITSFEGAVRAASEHVLSRRTSPVTRTPGGVRS